MLNLLSAAAASFQIDGFDALGGHSPDDLTGLIAVIMIFALPAVIVIAVLLSRAYQQRLQNEIVTKLAAAGQPVPPELFTSMRSGRSDLSRGLAMVAAGASLTLAFWLTGNDRAWPFALIPIFLGVARLVAWAIEGRRTRQDS